MQTHTKGSLTLRNLYRPRLTPKVQFAVWSWNWSTGQHESPPDNCCQNVTDAFFVTMGKISLYICLPSQKECISIQSSSS